LAFCSIMAIRGEHGAGAGIITPASLFC
jgi:hypothetical protein